jgi:hypothetical protein
MAAKKYIVNGKIFETDTTEKKAIVNGRIVQTEADAGGGPTFQPAWAVHATQTIVNGNVT